MPEREVYFRQSRTYELIVKIKDLEYTQDVTRVSVFSSLTTAYQVVTITMLIDPNDVVLEDVFGNEPIKLTINRLSQDNVPSDGIEMELVYLKSDLPITEKSTLSKSTQKDRVPFTITTVVRPAYNTMMTIVNGVYIGQTLDTIISDLASQAGTTINYDSEGRNTETIDQVCVPPITLYRAIKEHMRTASNVFDGFLDQRFGLFEGVPGVFCQYDNKVYIKNLTRKLQKNQTFTVYQLATEGGENNEEIMEKSVDGKNFYTYDKIKSDYSANSRLANLGTTLNHIVKPNDSLAGILQQNLIEVAQNYSLVYKNSNLSHDSGITKESYFMGDTGYNTSRTLFNSRFGRVMSDMSTISFRVERSLPILNLLNVGEAVKFKPQTVEYSDFEGKYILYSSALVFERKGDWSSVATLNLMRTNKKS
jgi:hypothetical protein